MKKVSSRKFVNSKGQTAVEYVIFVAVLALIIISLSAKLKAFLLSDDGECNNPTENKSFICQAFKFGILNEESGYRTFKLMRFPK